MFPLAITPAFAAILQESLLQHALADPNTLGEALREYVFVGEGTGCYANFTTREDLQLRENTTASPLFAYLTRDFDVDDDWRGEDDRRFLQTATLLENDFLEVCWHWDGDGHLAFRIKDTGVILENTDCKCDYTWRIADPAE